MMGNPTTTGNRFEIVFNELDRLQSLADRETGVRVTLPDPGLVELREIDELRRMAMELAMPRPTSCTGTCAGPQLTSMRRFDTLDSHRCSAAE